MMVYPNISNYLALLLFCETSASMISMCVRHFGGSLRQGEWWGIGTSCQVGHPRQMHPWKSSETWFWYPKLSHPLMSMSPLIERKLGDIVVWSLIEPTSLAHALKSSRFSSQGKGIPSCNTNIEDGWNLFWCPCMTWHSFVYTKYNALWIYHNILSYVYYHDNMSW